MNRDPSTVPQLAQKFTTNPSTGFNIWKILTIALASLLVLSSVAYLVLRYLFPRVGLPSFIDLAALGSGLLGIVLGVLTMALLILVPVVLLILFSMIVGYGLGIGFSYSDVGKAIISRGE